MFTDNKSIGAREMRQRNIWIRRKKDKLKPVQYVVEGKTGKKTKYIWTISKDLVKLVNHLIKTSFFTERKQEEISKILDSLNIKEKEAKKAL